MSFLSTISVFQKARLKLTLWYLLIVMVISTAFTIGIYRSMTEELNRFEEIQQRHLDAKLKLDPFIRELPDGARVILRERMLDTSVLEEARRRIQFTLLLINLTILATAGAVGYLLAGKTLKPIQEMVDEQNRFITDSSHELRTPLTALRSEMEVTLRDKNLKLNDAKKIIESNLEEIVSIQSLTDNLLKLTKSFKQKSMEATDLDQVLKEAIKKVLPMAKKKGIEIKEKSAGTIIKGNAHELTELLVIFLDNAIKYSDNNSEIEISEKKKGNEIEIKVKDYGIGIDQKDLPFLFDRFYRTDKSRSKNDAEGFGLGLSIAKRIVDRYNGKISVESKLEQGTTFTITLPIKQTSRLKKIKPFI